jgi:HAD domain in Swiss Army Knife RNA repair proteins
MGAAEPLLLLDVDGVLSPFGGGPPPGFTRTEIDGYQVTWSQRHRKWLAELAPLFDMVWATTWEHKANKAISPLLGLPRLPVVEFDRKRSGDTWKLKDIAAYVGDRPMAWVDDELYTDAFNWERQRWAPTLLIRPMSSVGLTELHTAELEAFGRSVPDLMGWDEDEPC